MPTCTSCNQNGQLYCVDWSERVNGNPVLDAGSVGADGKRTFIFPGVYVAESCTISWSGQDGTQSAPLCADIKRPASGPNGANVLDIICADSDNPAPTDGIYFGINDLNALIDLRLQFHGLIP